MKHAIADAHCHTNPVKGIGARIVAERFKKSGGWFIAIVSLPPWSYGFKGGTLDDYKKMIEILLQECKNAREVGLEISCIGGFHPAIIDKLADQGMELEKIRELGLKVINYVATLCRQGILDGIGEVGRQHYKTMPERVVLAEELLEYALEVARDYDCILHLHLENAGTYTIGNIHRTMQRLRIHDYTKIVFHHVTTRMLSHAVNNNIVSTVPGLEGVLLKVAELRIRPWFMIESDYLDDPKRPGAVVYPWQLSAIQRKLLDKGVFNEEYLFKVNVDMVERVYNKKYK